jgi:hypothetical protein
VSGKARVQAALREVALATSATVRPRPPAHARAARPDPVPPGLLGVWRSMGSMLPAPAAAPRKHLKQYRFATIGWTSSPCSMGETAGNLCCCFGL